MFFYKIILKIFIKDNIFVENITKRWRHPRLWMKAVEKIEKFYMYKFKLKKVVKSENKI